MQDGWARCMLFDDCTTCSGIHVAVDANQTDAYLCTRDICTRYWCDGDKVYSFVVVKLKVSNFVSTIHCQIWGNACTFTSYTKTTYIVLAYDHNLVAQVRTRAKSKLCHQDVRIAASLTRLIWLTVHIRSSRWVINDDRLQILREQGLQPPGRPPVVRPGGGTLLAQRCRARRTGGEVANVLHVPSRTSRPSRVQGSVACGVGRAESGIRCIGST
ncbi:hypothetical protein F4808DRAFT_137492 [Astrocystis sublimbata]|nr:hypothetical protein F4808DRAFT_137492 [Astrocystis sublimbata]